MDCIFCDIADHSVSAEILHETEELVVFEDIKPKAPVHILIIPKKHVPSIKKLTGADHALVSGLIYAAKDMAERQHLSGYRLCFNVGREGGQVVDHLHLHLLGGWTETQLD